MMLTTHKRALLAAMVLLCGGGVFWKISDGVRRERLNAPLIEAVQKEDPAAVQKLLEQGADPNARVQDPNAPHTLLAFLRKLFSDSRHAGHSEAPTALILAAQRNEGDQVARLLLDKGADKELAGTFGYSWFEPGSVGTPLITAACNRHASILRLLLERGANPNAASSTKQTALMFVAVKGEVGMAKLLLDRGADPNARDSYGNFALGDTADWLQRYETEHPLYDLDGKTPLSPEAAHLRMVQLLLAAKAQPNARFANGATALSTAANGKHPTLIRALLDGGADPRQVDNNGRNALHYALDTFNDWDSHISDARRMETIRLLLQSGLDINVQSKSGETALIMAASEQDTPIVRLLLSYHPDLNIVCSSTGMTALQTAKDQYDQEVYRLLKQAGAK